MSPLKLSYARSFKEWEEMSLEIFRAHAVDERIRTIAGKNKKWQTEKFKGADLSGSVNMRIDERGLFPKSAATERAEIAQLIQLGVINPRDPVQQWAVLEVFGKTKLRGAEDIDVQEAVKEWDKFLTGGEEPLMIPLVQNSIVHIQQHANAAKTDEFRELPPEAQQAWINHINLHYTDLMARQALAPVFDPRQAPPDGSGKASTELAGSEPRSQAGNNMGNEQAKSAPIAKGKAVAAGERAPGEIV